MTARRPKRKPRVEMQAEEARRSFSDCLERAGFGNERIVVGRYGKQLAAIVSMGDLRRLEEDEAA